MDSYILWKHSTKCAVHSVRLAPPYAKHAASLAGAVVYMYMYKYMSIGSLTLEESTKMPWFGLHLKYFNPDLEPSFLPSGWSNSTPNQYLHRRHPCINRIHWKVASDPGLPRLLVT